MSPLHIDDPAQIGRYALAGRLGAGGMGVVYLGRSSTGEYAAIKLVRETLADDPEFRARFAAEVRRARQVPPFCTAEVLDADLEHDPPYLVVEYVDGPSLAEVVRDRGPLKAANLHSVAVGVATALAAIHGAGVIHRDLKPQNVLLAPGSPKVIDFGISAALDGDTRLTEAHQVLGTVAYMAPERLTGDLGTPLTPASDVFSWGCVVAYAGLGRTPFKGDSPTATAAGILTGTPRLDGLPEPLRGLVERALAKDPADRPAARELVDLLLHPQPATGEQGAPTVVMNDEPAAPVRRRSWPALLAGLLVLVLGTTAAGLLLRPDAPGATPPAAIPSPSVQTILQDPLTAPGLWQNVDSPGKNGRCVVKDRLTAERQTPGLYQCAGPRQEITGDFAVEVTLSLLARGSCAVAWFHWSETTHTGHSLRVCQLALSVAHGEPEGRTLIGSLDLTQPIGLGEEVRIVMTVRGHVVEVSRDGQVIGEVRLPDGGPDRGQFLLGITTTDAAKAPPYTVTFSGLDVRAL
ncbi:serine/threonine-protein kinase [Catenuloplanes japonicus]|uniref:serine/threonine-protein kinase n=1 Tax=Catenuloplanes japonicus TaxID=33876 RepID=UPI000527127C|nr:serine/threonine-protein kinase [Catenuloplanes japonicus]